NNTRGDHNGSLMSARLDHAHSVRAGKYGSFRQPDEYSMLDHAGNADKLRGQRAWIRYPAERNVDDPVAPIRDGSVAVRPAAQHRGRGIAVEPRGVLYGPQRGRKPKRNHLDRQRKAPERWNPL